MSTFIERFRNRVAERRSLLCVGLDPDPDRVPEGVTLSLDGLDDFLARIIEGTRALAVAYKPNLAFFEALPFGDELLHRTVRRLQNGDSPPLVIGDAKRGDISNTTRGYAIAAFDVFGFDAVTASPYMGLESLEPFIEYRDRAVMVLCLTSNPGAAEFQLQGEPALFERVAERVAEQQRSSGNLWMVVGATREGDGIRRVRAIAPEVPLLVPGVGAQGGSLETVLEQAGTACLINASRSIMYAGRTKAMVAEAAQGAAQELVSDMRALLPELADRV